MEGRGGGLARRSKEGKRDVDTSVEDKTTRAQRHSKRKKGEGKERGRREQGLWVWVRRGW